MNDHSTDVVVVGCGPVGVMCALRCAQQGLNVVAIDRSTEVYPLPRAIGMDDEIQRVFHAAGLGAAIDEHSTPMLGAEFVDADGNRLTGLELPPGTLGALGYPPIVSFDQPALERALRQAAAEAGVEFRLGHTAVSVETDAHSALVHLRQPDGTATDIRGRWLVAADGASSTIRKMMGIELIDLGFDQMWLVVDTTLTDTRIALPHLATQVCDPARVITFVPGHQQRRRWEFQLRPDETADEMEEPSRVAELLAPWGTAAELQVDRTAVYRFHATVAETFRHNNVFIAGDAAHQMPPFNGQGMCSGIRDANNLAWKLAMVSSGQAGEELLDTYDAERRPHSAGQVEHSAAAGRLIDALARGEDVSTAAGYGGGRAFPHLEHGVLDGYHPSVGRQLPQPIAEGLGLDEHLGDHFTLITTTPPAAPEAEWWKNVGAQRLMLDAATLPGILTRGATIIVRPDRYVAAVTTDLEHTTRRLARTLGLPIS